MKILSSEQIHELDKYTIVHEPVSSIDLMERATSKLVEEFKALIQPDEVVNIFCGTGNNGGDGLAVARLLIEAGYKSIHTFVVRQNPGGSSDFLVNEERLKKLTSVTDIESETQIPAIEKGSVIIDAIFGSGLTRPADDIVALVINAINQSNSIVYAIDLPSGLFCDTANAPTDVIVKSTCTFTFHAPKLGFLFADNGKFIPEFKILDIGLSQEYEQELVVNYEYVDDALIEGIFKKRDKFSHKGNYGHALICAGSFGKIGAAVLSVGAALRSGAGLVSTHIPKCGYDIMQTANPEAMVMVDESETELTGYTDYSKFAAIGVGPGIGKDPKTANFVENLLRTNHRPMVIDADALNIISDMHYLRPLISPGSVLTPHPGEFKRLQGAWKDDMAKIQKQIALSKQSRIVIVLKGANTSISTPDGKVYFNSTGNPGMAKGGSGDVLTGIITALLAQGYSPENAAILGTFIHGRAGDIAAAALGVTGIKAGDIIQFLPEAFAAFE
jgi:NAD(P)H-hydrate epimerase